MKVAVKTSLSLLIYSCNCVTLTDKRVINQCLFVGEGMAMAMIMMIFSGQFCVAGAILILTLIVMMVLTGALLGGQTIISQVHEYDLLSCEYSGTLF